VRRCARRQVDDPLEGGVVIAVRGQAQVGERILDLGALEEAQAAINPVGMLALRNASSKTRDWALERYRMAISRRLPPRFIHSRMRLTTKSASSRSLNAA